MSDPNPARILIVDDDVAHAESLQDALELDGYLCAVVHGGAEALEVLQTVWKKAVEAKRARNQDQMSLKGLVMRVLGALALSCTVIVLWRLFYEGRSVEAPPAPSVHES